MMEWTVGEVAVGKIIPAAALLLGSWIDLQYRTVPLLLTAGMAFVGLGYRIITGQFLQWDWLLCLFPGIVMMIWAKRSGEKLGTGDAWMVLALGTMLDFSCVVGTVVCAFWFAGIMALFVFILKRKKNTELPFVPFVFLGYVISLAAGGS